MAADKMSLVQITAPFSIWEIFSMTLSNRSWFWHIYPENSALFQILATANSHLRHTDSTPDELRTAEHILKVIFIEKDTVLRKHPTEVVR